MKIQFKKGKDKPSTLTCTRKDGSYTWAKIPLGFEAHDLAHYAVETILGLDNAFYGLLIQGFNIEGFELPRDQRPKALIPANLPVESLQTEHLVNLLMTGQQRDEKEFDLINILKQILTKEELPYPENLTSETLILIQNRFGVLTEKWDTLEEGTTLDLTFGS